MYNVYVLYFSMSALYTIYKWITLRVEIEKQVETVIIY